MVGYLTRYLVGNLKLVKIKKISFIGLLKVFSLNLGTSLGINIMTGSMLTGNTFMVYLLHTPGPPPPRCLLPLWKLSNKILSSKHLRHMVKFPWICFACKLLSQNARLFVLYLFFRKEFFFFTMFFYENLENNLFFWSLRPLMPHWFLLTW